MAAHAAGHASSGTTEQTPLLAGESHNDTVKATTLDMGSVAVLCFTQMYVKWNSMLRATPGVSTCRV